MPSAPWRVAFLSVALWDLVGAEGLTPTAAKWARKWCQVEPQLKTPYEDHAELRESICDEHGCDEYSLGSRFCLSWMGLPHKTPRALMGEPSWHHCLTAGLYERPPDSHVQHPAPLLFCPNSLPLAVLQTPKAGSTAFTHWMHTIETSYLSISMLARSCYMNAGFNPVDANRLLQCFANGLYHQVGNLSEQLPGLNLKHLGCSRVGAYRLAEMAFLMSAEKTLGWLVAPPFMCHQCCQQGHGRLMVLLARNPYMRVASYFKRWMITKFGGWPNFATFVTVLMEVTNTTNCFRDCIGAEFPWLNSDDVLHLRSVKEMLDDPRIQPPRSTRQFSVLRLENWKEDWKAIEDRLCSEFHHCEHLPPPPRAKGDHHAHTERLTRDVNSWAKLWQDLKKPMLFRYGWDFYHLGYSTDPTKLRPLRPAQPSRST